MTTPTPRSSRPALLLLAAVLLAVAAVTVWWFGFRKPSPQSDPVAATAANARGVGYMEQFDYAKAAAEFEQALRLAP